MNENSAKSQNYFDCFENNVYFINKIRFSVEHCSLTSTFYYLFLQILLWFCLFIFLHIYLYFHINSYFYIYIFTYIQFYIFQFLFLNNITENIKHNLVYILVRQYLTYIQTKCSYKIFYSCVKDSQSTGYSYYKQTVRHTRRCDTCNAIQCNTCNANTGLYQGKVVQSGS